MKVPNHTPFPTVVAPGQYANMVLSEAITWLMLGGADQDLLKELVGTVGLSHLGSSLGP